MKKIGKRICTIGLLSCVFALFTTAGIVAGAEDNPTVGLTQPLVEKVHIGEEVQLPDYYVLVGGAAVKADAKVISPQGKAYTGTKFTANEAGQYVVEYTVDGVVVHTEYCKSVISAENMFSGNAFADVDGIANYAYQADDAFKGVAVNVQNGATITYEQEIDMSVLTKNDLLFEATIEPTTKGDTDFKQMIMTFSDVEDPSSSFRVTVTDGHADGGSPKHIVYINTAANGQTAGGYNYDNAQKGVFWEAKDIYGTSVFASFRAETAGNNESEHSIKLYYDANENALYTCRYGVTSLVSDFDDPVVFPSTSWSGFSSGKAKLTISFVDVKADGGRIIVNEVAGLRLVNEEIVDDVAPELQIDLLGESKAPNSLLGTTYKVFPYTTYDFFDTSVDVSVTVKHENIFTGVKTDVSVTDDTFVTSKLGKYTIHYVATDYSGNQTTKEVSFECVAVAEEIVLTNIPADFSVNAFENVSVPSVNEIRGFGGNGDIRIALKVLDPDGEEIAVKNNCFVPEKIGEYQAVYTATDFYGVSKSAALKINVLPNEQTVFMNEIVLPDLLVAGFEYTIPQIYAKTCYNGEVVDCQIDYYVNGMKLDATRTFTASGSVALVECRAYVQNNAVHEKIEKSVIIVNGQGGKNQAAYFYDTTGKITVNETMNSVDLTTSSDSTVAFANKLKGEGFSLGVSYLPEQAKFTSLNIVLCDAENSALTVTLAFELLENEVMLTVPYGTKTEFSSVENYFKFNFDSDSGLISDANGIAMAYVDKDDAGNNFNGFTGGIYARISFNEVQAESKVSLVSINNQPLGFRSENEEDIGDTVGPEIEISGEISVKAKRGDELTVYSCRAYDVLNQVASVTVSVQDPSNSVIVAETAADEDFVVQLSKCGYYRVIYTAYDTAGMRSVLVRNIRVVDAVAPTLTVEYSDMTKSVGDVVELPKVAASDDSGFVCYDIFVSFPNSEMRLVTHYENGTVTSYLDKNDNNYSPSFKVTDTSFKVEMKGKYVITVMAYDNDYNVTMQSFTITVK